MKAVIGFMLAIASFLAVAVVWYGFQLLFWVERHGKASDDDNKGDRDPRSVRQRTSGVH